MACVVSRPFHFWKFFSECGCQQNDMSSCMLFIPKNSQKEYLQAHEKFKNRREEHYFMSYIIYGVEHESIICSQVSNS